MGVNRQTHRPRVLRLPGFRCIAASSFSAACFSVFVLEKGQVQYMASMATTVLTLLCFLPAIILAKPQYSSSGIPANVLDGLPSQNFYQPEKSPNIPILPGERRCGNYYNGEVMPCLMRPWLPPFSYSTTEGNNGEYKRRGGQRGPGELSSRAQG